MFDALLSKLEDTPNDVLLRLWALIRGGDWRADSLDGVIERFHIPITRRFQIRKQETGSATLDRNAACRCSFPDAAPVDPAVDRKPSDPVIC